VKKFLLKNIYFFFVFGVITLPLVLILSSYDNADKSRSANHNIISLQTKSDFDSLDILFVGNSYCYSSINTKFLDSLNILSFNLGIASAGVQFYDLIINDYLAKIESPPKKVLLMVTPMTFSSKSDNFNAYPIHRYLESPKSNFQVALKYNRINELLSMHKKSISKGIHNIISKASTIKSIPHDNNNGFVPSEEEVSNKVISKEEYSYLPFKNDLFEKSKVEYLLDIASSVEKRGSEVVFFELPTYLLYRYFSKTYLDNYETALVQINESFELIRLNSRLFQKENYRNIDHMNSSGSIIATKQIVNYLDVCAF
jgi:hypothetical protein